MTLVTNEMPEKPPTILLQSELVIPFDEDTSLPTVKTEEVMKVLQPEEVLSEIPSEDKSEESLETTRKKFVSIDSDTKALKGWLIDYNNALLNLKIIQEAGIEIMLPFFTEIRKKEFSKLLDEQTRLGQKVVKTVIESFEMRTAKELALKELTMLKQGDLSVSEYAEEIRTLGEYAYDKEVPVDIREALLSNHFLENSDDRFRKEMMKTDIIPQTLDEMVMRFERFQKLEECQSVTDELSVWEAYYQMKEDETEIQETSDKLLALRQWLVTSERKTDCNRSYRNSFSFPSSNDQRSAQVIATTPFYGLAKHRIVPWDRYNPNVRQSQKFGTPQHFGGSYSNGNRFQRNQTSIPNARAYCNGNQSQRFQAQISSNKHFQQTKKSNETCKVSKGKAKAASNYSPKNRTPHISNRGSKKTLQKLMIALCMMMMMFIRPTVAVSSSSINVPEAWKTNATIIVDSSTLQKMESESIHNSLQSIEIDIITNLTLFCLGKIGQVIIRSVTNHYVFKHVIIAEGLKQLQPDGIIECREVIRYRKCNGDDLIDISLRMQIVNNLETSKNCNTWLERSNWKSSILSVPTENDYSRRFANASTLNKVLKCSFPSGQWEFKRCIIVCKNFYLFQHQETNKVNKYTDRYFVIPEIEKVWTSWEELVDLVNMVTGITIGSVNGNVDAKGVSSRNLTYEHLIPNNIRRLESHRKMKRAFLDFNQLEQSAINTKALEEFVKSIMDKQKQDHALKMTLWYRTKLIADPEIQYLDTNRMTNNRIVAVIRIIWPKVMYLLSQRLDNRVEVVSGIRHVINLMSKWLKKTLKTRTRTVSTSQLSTMLEKYLGSDLYVSFDLETGKRKKKKRRNI